MALTRIKIPKSWPSRGMIACMRIYLNTSAIVRADTGIRSVGVVPLAGMAAIEIDRNCEYGTSLRKSSALSRFVGEE